MMKPRSAYEKVAAVAALVVGLAVLASVSPRSGPERQRWTFTEQVDLSTPVERAGAWQLADDEQATGGRALVNHAGHGDAGAALAVTGALRARDVRVATRCRVEPPGTACGVIFRFHDADHYYLAHVDAASGLVSLGAVVGGSERTIRQVVAEVPTGIWQDVSVEARADRIVVRWNGEEVIDVHDLTLSNAGGVGLWARSADVVSFDELTVEPFPASPHPVELFPFLLKKRT